MKIPNHAKKVFDGVIFDVYQWEQEMFDGSMQTFEMLKRPDKVEVIAVSGLEVYLAKQSQPGQGEFYCLFGGRVNDHETIHDAARRELREESGMSCGVLDELLVTQPQSKIDWSVHTLIARDCHKVHEPTLDSGEKSETRACTFEEFIEIVVDESFRNQEVSTYVLRLLHTGNLDSLRNALFESTQ